jgi:hypothetical protein
MLDLLSNFMNFLNIGWVGSTIGISGVIISLALYFISKREGKPVCHIESWTFIGIRGKLPRKKVKILYDGEEVNKLVKTTVFFWNNGRAPIRNTDTVSSNPLRIEFSDDTRILSVQIRKINNPANKINLTVPFGYLNSVRIDFDFLNPGDGIAFEVFHNGNQNHVDFRGQLIGGTRGKIKTSSEVGRRILRNYPFFDYISRAKRFSLIMLAFSFFIFFISIIAFYIPQYFGNFLSNSPVSIIQAPYILLFYALTLSFLPLFILYLIWTRFPKSLVHSEDLDFDGT